MHKEPNTVMNDYTKNISESIFSPALYSSNKLTKYSTIYGTPTKDGLGVKRLVEWEKHKKFHKSNYK